MKRYSIMEVQHNLAAVLREVDAGEEVLITRRKKVVARLLPAEEEEAVVFPDFEARAKAIWGGSWQGSTSDELIDYGRGER